MRSGLFWLALTGCVLESGKEVPPVKGGAGVSVDPATQQVTLDTSKIPSVADCAAGQIVRRTAGGWECVAYSWELVGDKPALAPAAHTHPVADVIGLNWASIPDKPPLAPLAHKHGADEVTEVLWGNVAGKPNVVTDVTATSPLASTRGATPNLSLPQASASSAGYLSAADWSTFNAKPRTRGGSSIIDWFPSAAAWTLLPQGTGTVSLNTVDVLEGDSSFDFTASAGGWWTYGDLIPIDPRTTYLGQVSAKLVFGTGTFYAGYVAYSAARNPLVGNGDGGDYGYFIARAVTLTPNTWTQLTGTIQGEGSDLNQFPVGTRFIRPLVITNYPASGTTRVDALSISPAPGVLSSGNPPWGLSGTWVTVYGFSGAAAGYAYRGTTVLQKLAAYSNIFTVYKMDSDDYALEIHYSGPNTSIRLNGSTLEVQQNSGADQTGSPGHYRIYNGVWSGVEWSTIH